MTYRHALRRSLLRTITMFLLVLAGCTGMHASGPQAPPESQDHSLAGVIIDADGKTVGEQALTDALQSADFAFIGEMHDNADHHAIEADLIASRLSRKPGSAVVFEMLDDSQQPLIRQLDAGDDLVAIRHKLAWPDKGWPLDTYGPLFQATLANGSLVAGNIDKPLIGRLYEEGPAPLAGDPRFATVAMASDATRQHLLDRIFEAHCGMQERTSLSPMLTIQLAKDASMADAMRRNAPALLIAGGEHVRRDTGVPSHLLAAMPQARMLVIQLLEVPSGKQTADDAVQSAGPADYYWFTPATEAKDACAGVTGRAAH